MENTTYSNFWLMLEDTYTNEKPELLRKTRI